MGDRFSGRHWQVAVLVAAVLLLGTRLGGVDLWAPDEPRYAQVAEEVRSFDRGLEGLFLLSLNGEVYDQKPPLYYWFAAMAGIPEGRVSEWAARAPSALAGIGLVALTLAFGARLLGRPAASFGAMFLLTAGLFPHLARRAQLDILLALFETLALVGFWRLQRGDGSRRANLLLLHASMGLGVLTKGPVGVLIPALIILAYLAWEGRLRELRAIFPVRMLALSVLPGVAWVVLATALAPEGFFHTAVVDNLYGRYFEGTSKVNPWYYFFQVFPLGFAPWSLIWPVVAYVGWRGIFARRGASEASMEANDPRPAWRFLLTWVGVTLLFFSLSTGKRDLYLIPCYPAVALLCGDAVVRALRGWESLPRSVGWAVAAFAGVLVTGSLILALFPVIEGVDVPILYAIAVIGILGTAALLWTRTGTGAHGALTQVAVAAGALAALQLATFTIFFPAMEEQKSPRFVAEAAAALVPPGEAIGLVEAGPMVGGLVYYSGRHVHEIGNANNLRRFFEEGGQVAVARVGAYERVHGEEFSEVRARFRSGRRGVVVVVPRAASTPIAPEPAPPTDELAGR